MKLIWLCVVIVSVTLGQPSKRQKKYHNDGTLSNCPCGSRNSDRIVGGKETRRNEYPWMVILKCGPILCGGSVITEYHVLTAAHCTNGINPNEIRIFVGKHNISSPSEGVTHSVEKIIQHEEFTYNPNLLYDISILVTRREITFNRIVGPVCLPRKRFDLVNKELKVTGWGVTLGTGDRRILHEVDFRFVPFDECVRLRQSTLIKENLLCAQKDMKDLCDGDSGSPVVYLNKDNRRYSQVAVVSFTTSRCESRLPIVNSDVFSFLDWILAAISGSKPGVKACAGN